MVNMATKKRCAYLICSRKSATTFKFPRDPSRALAWLKASKRLDLLKFLSNGQLSENYQLCEDQFEERFVRSYKMFKRLAPNAIPTIFPPSHFSPSTNFEKQMQPAGVLDQNHLVASSTTKASLPKLHPDFSSGYAMVATSMRPSTGGISVLKTHHNPKIATSLDATNCTATIRMSSTCGTSLLKMHHNSTMSAGLDATNLMPTRRTSSTSGASVLRLNESDHNIELKTMGMMAGTSKSSSPSPQASQRAKYSSTQTPPTLSSQSPRKVRLRNTIKGLRKRISKMQDKTKTTEEKDWTLEDFKNICDKFLDKPFSEIVKAQVLLKNKTPLARRYSADYKRFALSLYYLGRKSYSFLSKFLCLPTVRNLQQMTKKIVCRPGLSNRAIFKALELKITTMLEQDKHCTLCIDEMALKSNLFYLTGRDEIIGFHDIGNGKKELTYAQNALVIMVRGLYSNWKQPIAYFFLNSTFDSKELRNVLEECVLKLKNVGLVVDALITDMGSNFIRLSKSLGCTPEFPEFEMAGAKIIYLFDTCHLLKATRNNLINNIFHFNGKKTSWSFIECFFKEDSKQFYRCASKLTNAHIYPTNFEKMRVKYAAQVLSHSVAGGMHAYVRLGELPREAMGTIEVIQKFNNLFDMLNSMDLREKQHFKQVFVGDEFQITFLNEIIIFLETLKIFNKNGDDVTPKSKFRKCWLVTISGIQKLWGKLSRVGFKYLKTRKLNTDCLENFFGSIRQQGGNALNPTPIQFERAFRKLLFQNVLHSNNMNCNEDFDKILLDIDPKTLESLEDSKEILIGAIPLHDYSYRNETLPVQNAFRYVCGYLLKKALNIHKCDMCTEFSKHAENVDFNQLLTYFKAYDRNRSVYGGLRTPSEDFVNYIYNLENIFINHYDEVHSKMGISNAYFNIMTNVPFNHPCQSFPREYVLKLFIRLKIFYTLKYANRDIQQNKKNIRNRKIQILSHL